jgi:hypothetical protein
MLSLVIRIQKRREEIFTLKISSAVEIFTDRRHENEKLARKMQNKCCLVAFIYVIIRILSNVVGFGWKKWEKNF